MKKILLVFSFSLAVSSLCAQVKWPAITQTSKPWTRWWWEGSAVNPNDLTWNMELYKAAGLGGLEITPIYGVAGYEKQFVDYLSPQWMQLLDHTLREGKRLDLGIDMATGTGWPFGGGPLIGAEDACRDFVYKTWTLKKGDRLKEAVTYIQEPFVRAVGNQVYELHGIYKTEPAKGTIDQPLLKEASRPPDISKLVEPVYDNKNLQALALDQVKFRKPLPLQALMAYGSKGEKIDLTSKVDANGKLNWKAPAGEWKLYAIFMGWHGKMVERAAPGGEGNVIDHFSLAPLNKYLGRFDNAFTGHSLNGMRGFFNDSYEVDDARGQSNWTPALFDEFKNRRGYDLRHHLPALLQGKPDDNSLRILYDYRLTISELLLEKFTTPWQQWAKAKGKMVRNQSHGSPANILDLYGAIDIPETEGTEILRFKFAASAAHVLGKPLVSAEAATWLNEHFRSGLRDVKLSVDKYFLGGVNHIVYHGTCYSPKDEPWPGWLFYAAVHFHPNNPFWKDFSTLNNYVARCQSFLQSGQPDNDVLLYFPFSDKISSPSTARGMLHHFDGMNGFENTDFNEVAEELLHQGYAFDLVSDKQLLQSKFENGVIKTPGGTYKTLLLPHAKYIPLDSWQNIIALAQSGAKVVFYKNFPQDVPGYNELDKKRADLLMTYTKFHFEKMDGKPVKKAAIGNGAFIMSDDVTQALDVANIQRETLTDQGLQCIKRKTEDGYYYFISNASNKPVDTWTPLAVKATSVVLFDAMQQRQGLGKIRNAANGSVEVYLQLQPGESIILQTAATAVQGEPFPYIEAKGMAQEIKGTWTLEFLNGGPSLPSKVSLTQLGAWTALPGEEVKTFSGTAEYSIRFARPAADINGTSFLLNLGKVEKSAAIILNGNTIATLIGPVYQVTIPAAAFRDDNLLQVRVSNGMANRIIHLEKQGAEWKKFYNVNFPARLAENRGANGLFTPIKWQPETSGLIGPVTMRNVK